MTRQKIEHGGNEHDGTLWNGDDPKNKKKGEKKNKETLQQGVYVALVLGQLILFSVFVS